MKAIKRMLWIQAVVVFAELIGEYIKSSVVLLSQVARAEAIAFGVSSDIKVYD